MIEVLISWLILMVAVAGTVAMLYIPVSWLCERYGAAARKSFRESAFSKFLRRFNR